MFMSEQGSKRKTSVGSFGELDKLLGIQRPELKAKRPRKNKTKPDRKARNSSKRSSAPRQISKSAERISSDSIAAAYRSPSNLPKNQPQEQTIESAASELPAITGLIFPEKPLVGEGALQPMPKPFHNSPDSDNEFLMGIDFGTSNTKVVIRDGVQETRYVVEFDVYSDEPCLLPSRLKMVGKECRFATPNETGLPNLKFLIKEGRELALPVAYLAMVLRTAQQKYEEYRLSKGLDPSGDWLFNLGVPIAHWDEVSLRNSYEAVFVAAVELAFDAETTRINVESAERALHATDFRHSDRCQLVPELAAMLTGFVESRAHSKDRTTYLLVDVGGGTVDFSVVNITQNGGDTQFWAFASEVEWLGVDHLENKRVDWTHKHLADSAGADFLNQLDEWRTLAGTARPVHPLFENYFGWSTGALAASSNRGPDQEMGGEIALKLLEPIRDRSINVHRIQERFWYDMPLIMTGGGGDLPAFRGLFDRLSTGTTKNVKWGFTRMAQIKLEVSNRALEFRRFGVAFGLSFPVPGDAIGPSAFAHEQTRQDSVRNRFLELVEDVDGGPDFVSADQM